MIFHFIKKIQFFSFFLGVVLVFLPRLLADDFLGFQRGITEIFNQKKTAVVRVFGVHAAGDPCNSSNEKPSMDVGTGFFISREGHIVTIANIVNEAQRISVLYNDILYPAELVGYDNITNIAIIRLLNPPSDIPFFYLGESMELPQPSVILLAITCKLGLDPGPSMGMVAGWHTAFFDRIFPTTFLRSSIPSDGGEGGSPVFDLTGCFIGVMVSAIDGIRSSFIIPARVVMRIRDDLVFSGKVSYAYFGIECKASGSFLIIDKVIEGDPAHEAGLRSGDKILEFNNRPTSSVMDLYNAIYFAHPGQLLPVKVQRGEEELKFIIRLKEQSSALCSVKAMPSEETRKPLVVKNDSSTYQDVSTKIKEVIQKGNRWRSYLKTE